MYSPCCFAAATLSVWISETRSPPAGAVSTAITGMPACVGRFDALDDTSRIDGAHDDAVIALRDRILELGDLIGHAGGVGQRNDIDRHTVFGCSRLDRLPS